MRFLLYNIRYATAHKRPRFPWSGYFRRTSSHLDRIIEFIRPLDPDLVGLVEVDGGSFRTGKRPQAEAVAGALGHYHSYESKYCDSTRVSSLPVFKNQGNAFLAKNTINHERFHYFDKGFKRLVIELELEHITVFLVHLALGFRVRHRQLATLSALVRKTDKPHIVAGDFNALWGEDEIDMFLAATGLVNANLDSAASFPSWSPSRHLDFVLHSPEIKPTRFWMPDVQLSDHLPLVFDFDLPDASPSGSDEIVV
jgi:endonuclease/exonuclease/phosphatase family metal-dependent hydrolase